MKIVYVETGIKGHKLVYLSNLTRERQLNDAIIVPEHIDGFNGHQYVAAPPTGEKRTVSQYLNWLKEIKGYIDKEDPDIVHFISGDDFYKFFGFGLGQFHKYKVLITLHWVRPDKAAHMSIKCISKKVAGIVVHSVFLKKQLNDLGINNVYHIEYPQFNQIVVDERVAKKYWGLNPDITTLACVGSTRYDKGLDLLIEALKKVNQPFQLLVAGQVNKFTEADILEMGQTIKDKMFLSIHYLSDEELAYAFAACDIIVLPYRKSFNGASGPLGEGVSYDKCILGAGHGNLGYTIRQHHLGYTFDSENIDDLARVISLALDKDFILDDEYIAYKESLNPNIFRKSYGTLYESLLGR